jgi:hypothetical protein
MRSSASAALTQSFAPFRVHMLRLALLPFLGLAIGFTAAGVLAAATAEYAVTDVYAVAEKSQATLTKVQGDDPACSAQLNLLETEQDGEHAVYGAVALQGASTLRLNAKAGGRYGIQFGFASSDWKSFVFASVNLISGSYRLAESGSLRGKGIAVRSAGGDWLEMELIAEDRGARDVKAETTVYAIIKPAMANGNTFYRGEAGRGVALCAAAIKGS